MTVQKDITKNIYIGNGSTTVFPVTFECPTEHPEYIKVYLIKEDGTSEATVDYLLDMDAKQIIYPSSGAALAEGKKIVIMRELPLQQLMNLVNNGPFFAEDIETTLDENVMMLQQMKEKLGRAVVMSTSVDSNDFVNEVPFEPGKSFRISDDGKRIELTTDPGKVIEEATSLKEETENARDTTLEAKNTAVEAANDALNSQKLIEKYKALWFNSVAAMKAEKSLKPGAVACTLGYYSPNDGGGATYIIRAKQESDVDDGGSLHELANGNVAEMVVENGTVCPEQFGAKGDNTEKIINDIDVTANGFHAAIGYCKEHDIVFTAPGKYVLNTSLIFDDVNCDITGIITSKITDGFAINIINSQRRTLKFYKIDSSVSGIRLYGKTKASFDNKIEWHTVRAQKIGFEISGVQPNYDNTIIYTVIKADDVCFNVRVDSDKGYISETRVFAGDNGGNKNKQCNCVLKMVGLSQRVGTLTYLETFYFYNLQLENCIKAMYLENVHYCMFYNPRTYELKANTIELTGWTHNINIIAPLVMFNLFYLHDFKYSNTPPTTNNQSIPLLVRGQLANRGGNIFSASEGQVTWVFNTDGTPVFTNPLGYINSASKKWDLTYLKDNINTITDPPAFISLNGANEVEIDENFYQKNKAVIRVRAASVSENNVATIKIGGKTFTFKEQYSSYELKNIQKLGTNEWVLEKVTYF